MFKSSLRRNFRHLRNNLPEDKRHRAEAEIAQRVINSEEFKSCDTLFAFMSTGSEVSTGAVIDAALKSGKRLALPLVTGKHDMCFIYVEDLNSLQRGCFGIMEPVMNEAAIALPGDNTLVLVPGLAFDASMNRLGYGGGYYDKYLSEHNNPMKMGICFHIQYTQVHLPHDPTDIPVDIFITENLIKRGN